MTASMKRKGGRPRNGDRQVIPWPEIDRLLVFGEMVRDETTGREDLRYPSQRELGRRYGVSGALIGRYAKEHQCMKRREENQNRAQARFEQKVVEKLAEARAISTAEAIEIVDAYMRAFREALEEGRVRVDNASDFNTMTRLKQFLEGKADSRQEVQGVITLEQMQARHRALRAQLESLDPAITGELPPRDRDRVRGLLPEQRREGGEAERLVAHPHPGGSTREAASVRALRRRRREDVDLRDEEERQDESVIHRVHDSEAGSGIARRPQRPRPVASRRYADGDIEPALRRRVVARGREDALLDDELAQEREDARRGTVRALRRRRREDVDIDHDAEREDARMHRLRRRTGEDTDSGHVVELDEARVARRAGAASPSRTAAPRSKRPGREHVEVPDVVYACSPGRGWENEPGPTEPGLCRPGKGWH
jgi:hypothetical protein